MSKTTRLAMTSFKIAARTNFATGLVMHLKNGLKKNRFVKLIL
jgi:hypothetical protein